MDAVATARDTRAASAVMCPDGYDQPSAVISGAASSGLGCFTRAFIANVESHPSGAITSHAQARFFSRLCHAHTDTTTAPK